MAVSSTTSQTAVTLTSNEQTVSIPWIFFENSDLVVEADEVVQVEGTDYSVAGGDGSTGSVTMLADGPTSGQSLVVYRSIPQTQILDLTSGGPLPPTEVEKALDRLCLIIQQLGRDTGLSLRLAVGEAEQTALRLTSGTPAVIGSDDGVNLEALTISELVTLLNLPSTVVDKPAKTWADDAARAVAVPDFIGQIGVQVDAISSGSSAPIYIGTAESAGSWSALSVVTASIAADAIDGTKIADDAIASEHLATDSVTADAIAADAVGSSEIADDAVGADQLADDGVGSAAIADDAVTNDHLANDAVNTDQIAADAVTQAKIADDAVGGDQLASGVFAFKGKTRYTSGSGTYTTPAGVRAILVKLWGAGGGGGGVDGQGSGSGGMGISGGGGAYVEKLITSPSASYSYAVGAGGTAGTAGANAGGAGGNTTFDGSTYQANGGAAGSGVTANNGHTAGAAGGTGSGGDLNLPGGASGPCLARGGNMVHLSEPGTAPYIGGAPVLPANGTAGNAASAPGAGGTGGVATDSDATDYAGGAGANGLIEIVEYY